MVGQDKQTFLRDEMLIISCPSVLTLCSWCPQELSQHDTRLFLMRCTRVGLNLL